jgi:hypothetical protein
MCQAASCITTKDAVLIGRTTNSHTEILKQHGITDTQQQPDFVKWECVPPDNDYSLPLDQWVYSVDQNYLPDWYVPELDEKRAREKLVQWYHEHITLQNTDTCELMQNTGDYSMQKSGDWSTQTAGRYSTQTAGSGGTQTAGYRCTQTAGDNSMQNADAYSTQTAGDDSTQTAGAYSTQTAGNDSTQTAGRYSTQTAGNGSRQNAGNCSTQIAGDRSTQNAGIGTVQIIRYYDNDKYKVKTRIITEKIANKPYKFYNNNWHLIK